jgi:hypothetical protein
MKAERMAAGALCAVLSLLPAHAPAQNDPASPYRSNTADEDWTFLKTAPKTDLWDPLKYIALGKEDWSLTLSGEARLRGEGFRVHDAELRDNYLLQRYLVGADLRLGRRIRLFGELQAGIINGSLRSPRPSDENTLDFHQAFFELRLPARENDEAAFVVGRQELEIGSSRLISASPGLNIKRSFDGLRASYRLSSWKIVGAVAKLVELDAGAFDDRPHPNQLFWAIAAGRPSPGLKRSEAGVYYLGFDNTEAVFAQGFGPERRHTVGLKWSGEAGIDVNYDALFQWGRFSGAPIRAWAFASETGYQLPSTAWRPRFSVRVDFASGDADALDPALQSFNPLFPGNAYSGAVGLLGPTNLTDFTPAVSVTPRRGLVVGFEAPSYWRTSTKDGVYSTDLRVLLRPEVGTGKYVGTNPAIVVVWQATRHLQFQGVATRFLSGAFLEDTFVASGFGFYSFTTRYRF